MLDRFRLELDASHIVELTSVEGFDVIVGVTFESSTDLGVFRLSSGVSPYRGGEHGAGPNERQRVCSVVAGEPGRRLSGTDLG